MLTVLVSSNFVVGWQHLINPEKINYIAKFFLAQGLEEEDFFRDLINFFPTVDVSPKNIISQKSN